VENFVTFDPGVEHGATFRFPVTWAYLTGEPNPAQSIPATPVALKATEPAPVRTLEVMDLPPLKDSPPMPPAVTAEPVPAPAPAEPLAVAAAAAAAGAVPALVPAQKPTMPRASAPEAKWEMVIPKMARPFTARVPRALPQPTQPVPMPAETLTEISFYAGSEASFVPRRWKVLSISAAVVVVGCVIALVRPGSQSSSGSESAASAAGTWSRRTAYVAGSKDPREILVYSGSDGLKNYRIEFAWVPDVRGVGWIYRASDSANYYATKLRLIQAGSSPTLSAEHFAVVKGVEGAHSRKVITLSRTKGEVLVRMDANGPSFTLFLQGSPTDYWTDERFDSGSLGFYEDRGERPALQGLRFTLFKKSGLQTVVTSLQ